MRVLRPACVIILLICAVACPAQVTFMGRVWAKRHSSVATQPADDGRPVDYFAPGRPADPAGYVPLANVRCFASRTGGAAQALGFRTWELAPTGWFTMSGPPGCYTLLFTGPSMYVRPVIYTNQFMADREAIDIKIEPPSDFASFDQAAWDDKAASDYYQTFTAAGTSITNVGFRVVHDGVDGGGPGGQTLLASIHNAGPGTPDTWEQVGPAVPVPQVDSGGPKCYDFTAGWNSGEVPTTPGGVYAVHLTAEQPDGTFQVFWRADDDRSADCYRVGAKGENGFRGRDLWIYIAGDADGLLIPYNKRVQKEYVQFAGFAPKWSQTYVARGRGLAAVQMYIATGGTQPGIQRQRAAVRIRKGGPAGPTVGPEKIAIGNGIHTGDAAWGTFGVVYAPGEVALEPGTTYAVELASIENHESLAGYVNIKNMPSDMRPGFNPYRKHPLDVYEAGTAFRNATEDAGFDLDMQIIEYQHAAHTWDQALEQPNLVANGEMVGGTLDKDQPAKGKPERWASWATESATVHQYQLDAPDNTNRFLRVVSPPGGNADGGWVQQVTGLRHGDAFRLTARIRCSWPLDREHACMVGIDPTGQTTDPKAATIIWTSGPATHSIWETLTAGPVRPAKDTVSIWLRARNTQPQGFPFRADFDNIALHRVRTTPPLPAPNASRPGAEFTMSSTGIIPLEVLPHDVQGYDSPR